MWAFLGEVLKQGGSVALLFTVAVGLFAVVVRALWEQNQALHKQIAALQEKRLEDAIKIQGQMLVHVESVNQTMNELSASFDVLVRLQGRK